MSGSRDTRRFDCDSCEIGCFDGSEDKAERTTGPLTGWKFSLTSVGVFFLPLATALGCAAAFGGSPAGQAVGGIAGLACGMAVSYAAGRVFLRTEYEGS